MLTKVPGSKLAQMFQETNKLFKNIDGVVFLDRNGTIFSYLIDWLRNNMKISEFGDKFTQNQFDLEIEFWGLNISPKIKEDQLKLIKNIFD